MQAPFSLDPLLRRYRDRRPQILGIYRQMFAEAHRLVTPHCIQRTFQPPELPILTGCFPGAETITLGLCTIGPALENRVSELFSTDPPAAVILDELGSLWVNGLGREMHAGIRAAAKAQGKQASPAYRPGIGRWPMELQNQLLAYLPAAGIGVSVTSGILVPQKTISMIVAVGRKLGKHCYTPGGKA